MPLLALKALRVNLCRDGPSADLKVIGREALERTLVRAPDVTEVPESLMSWQLP